MINLNPLNFKVSEIIFRLKQISLHLKNIINIIRIDLKEKLKLNLKYIVMFMNLIQERAVELIVETFI